MLYENIKRIAKEQGKTIATLEKDAGVCERSMSNWNTNKPSYDKVCAVAKALNVTVEQLVGSE